MIVQSGKPAYVRDGRVYEHGLVGDGLVEAVDGNPEAVEAALTYRRRQVGSLVALGVGAVCGAGFMITAIQAILDADEPHQDGANSHAVRDGFTLGFAACMTGGIITAVAMQAEAPAYHYDAINLYNDSLQNSCPAIPPNVPRLGPQQLVPSPALPPAPPHPAPASDH